MKIKISYIQEEGRLAEKTLATLMGRLPGAKVKKSKNKPPYLHIYLTTKQGKDA